MSKSINVLLKLPGEKLEAVSLDAELLTSGSGLHIDVASDIRLYYSKGCLNPHVIPMDLKYNCTVCNLDFWGAIVFVGYDGAELCDCPVWKDVSEFSRLWISHDSADDGAVDFNEDPDSHSCSAEADSHGYCQVCGSTVYGSAAYYEETGSDPPGTY